MLHVTKARKEYDMSTVYLCMYVWASVGSAVCVKWSHLQTTKWKRLSFVFYLDLNLSLLIPNFHSWKTLWETKTPQCIQGSMENVNQSKYFIVNTKCKCICI